jgi:hypothetical protein
MINSTTIDILISVVLVILTLSLIVQTLQELVKKFFKLRSAQLETSLVDLFEVALEQPSRAAGVKSRIANLINPMAGHRPIDETTPAARLQSAVLDELGKIGRVAATGTRMLDSISKQDLVRVLSEIDPTKIDPNVGASVTTLRSACDALKQAIADACASMPATDAARPVVDLCRDAERRLDSLSAVLRPVTSIDVATGLPLADLVKLVDDVRVLASQISALGGVDIGAAHDALDGAVGVCGRQIAAVGRVVKRTEDWFDTVMQGCAERYNRSMKTWSLLISALIVVVLNADVVAIYSRMANDNDTRQAAIDRKEQIINRMSQLKAESAETAGSSATDAEMKKLKETLDEDLSIYNELGFQPIAFSGIFSRTALSEAVAAVRAHALGWALMVMLLSFGAPFWNDALESLFGVKSLLRKKSSSRSDEDTTVPTNPGT